MRWESLSKTYPGGVPGLREMSAGVELGEFAVLVGASGSGKTTLLRLLAGLERPTSGRIWLDEQEVTHTAAHRRRVAMVFQRPMLYPHLTVRENLLWGATWRDERSSEERRTQAARLAPRGESRETPATDRPQRRWRRILRSWWPGRVEATPELRRRCDELAERMAIRELLDRRPDTLSGGECQRVAVARAFLRQPSVVLLDEPFTYLDVVQRQALRYWLQDVHRGLGGTLLMVTHDPDEAWMLGEKLIVLSRGRCLQVASRAEVGRQPASREVWDILSSGGVNWLTGTLRSAAGQWRLEVHGHDIDVSGPAIGCAEHFSQHEAGRVEAGRAEPRRVVVGVPPQGLTLRPTSGQSTSQARANRAHVDQIDWLSDRQVVHLRWSESGTASRAELAEGREVSSVAAASRTEAEPPLHVTVSHRETVQLGSTVEVQLSSDRLVFFDADTGKNLLLSERRR